MEAVWKTGLDLVNCHGNATTHVALTGMDEIAGCSGAAEYSRTPETFAFPLNILGVIGESNGPCLILARSFAEHGSWSTPTNRLERPLRSFSTRSILISRASETHEGIMLDKSVISNVQYYCAFRIIPLCGHVDANGGATLRIYFRHDNPQILSGMCVRSTFQASPALHTVRLRTVNLCRTELPVRARWLSLIGLDNEHINVITMK